LLDKGADTNIANIDGITALHLAIKRRHKKIVKLLVDKGADTNMYDSSGQISLHFACRSHLTDDGCDEDARELASLLVERGANIDAKYHKSKRTSLHDATISGYLGTVSLLLDHDADTEAIDNSRNAKIVTWKWPDCFTNGRPRG